MSVVRFRRPIRPSVRFAVFERDGFACQYCGAAGEGTILHADHVYAWVEGGSDDPGNLITACQDCNLGKGAARIFNVLMPHLFALDFVLSPRADMAVRSDLIRLGLRVGFEKLKDTCFIVALEHCADRLEPTPWSVVRRKIVAYLDGAEFEGEEVG